MFQLHYRAIRLVSALAVATALVTGACKSSGDAESGTACTTTPCEVKATLSGTSPQITDFEAAADPLDQFNFDTAFVLGGTYSYNDNSGTGSDVLALVLGHDASSTKALQGTFHSELWGAGMGLWFDGCVDAKLYKGVSFWAKGTVPAGRIEFSLGTQMQAGTAPKYSFTVTDTWKQFSVHWSDFNPCTDGDNFSGMNFNVGNDFTPHDMTFIIDDVAFLTN
jgi:hypothetical protein